MIKRSIRGHKRIWKNIEAWKEKNSRISAEQTDREYVKIWIYPYFDYAFSNSDLLEPKGETRRRILSGLLDIHDAWKKELDTLNQPYYLKIWLFEPRFSRSQVVCAVGESAGFYGNTFFKPESQRSFPLQNYGNLQNRMKELSWEHALDEIWIDNNSIGHPEDFVSDAEYYANRRWVKRKLAGPHRTEAYGSEETCYIKVGDVWIGGSV